MTVSIKISVCW